MDSELEHDVRLRLRGTQPLDDDDATLADYSLIGLMLGLAQVRHERRSRSRARLPTTHLALREQELVAQLRRHGVLLVDVDRPARAVLGGLG